MALEYSTPGTGALYAQLAQGVSEARGAEAATQRMHEQKMLAQQLESKRQMAEFEAELQTRATKMSMEWELEKMRRTSELEWADKEKEIQLKKDLRLEAEVQAKKRYTALAEHLDSDLTLTPEVRSKAKAAAYAQMIGQVELSSSLFKTETGEFGGMGGTMGGGTTSAPATAAPPTGMSYKGAVQQARLDVGVDATKEQVAQRADEIALDFYMNEALPSVQERLGAGATEQQIMDEVKRVATGRLIDAKVRAGYEQSKTLGVPQGLGAQLFEELAPLGAAQEKYFRNPAKVAQDVVPQIIRDIAKTKATRNERAAQGLLEASQRPTGAGPLLQGASQVLSNRKRDENLIKLSAASDLADAIKMRMEGGPPQAVEDTLRAAEARSHYISGRISGAWPTLEELDSYIRNSLNARKGKQRRGRVGSNYNPGERVRKGLKQVGGISGKTPTLSEMEKYLPTPTGAPGYNPGERIRRGLSQTGKVSR